MNGDDKMATYEHNALQNYKDNDGNIHIVYPVTKSDNVDGIENYATTTDMNTKIATKADYEEGEFTLVLGKNASEYYVSASDIDQVEVTGRYKRVGNMCYIAANYVVVFSDDTKGYLRIAGGLPFTLKDANSSIGFIGINCTPKGTIYPVNYINVNGFGGSVQFESVEVSKAINFRLNLLYEIKG